MKTSLIFLLALSLLLCSCGHPVSDVPKVTDELLTTSPDTKSDTTEADTTKETTTLPCLIGLYDDLYNNGTYTRLTEWNEPWIPGKDIAVFDVIPSAEETLTGRSYKKLWRAESDKISPETLVKPYFILEFTLKDGTEKTVEIRSYADAQNITDEGYLEVYLYDDIHQEDGVWYYHLTESTTDSETVISSFKLTAGKDIYSVKSITLSAYIEGSSASTVAIYNGYN